MDRHFALQVAHTVINGPKMGLRCGTQRAAELRARGSIGPQRSGYASCGWIRGPRGPGLFLRMRIVWRGRFCTKIGVFNRGYVGKDRAYPPLPEPRACLPPWTENMVSKLYPKRPGPLKVGWGLRHMLGRDMLCFS